MMIKRKLDKLLRDKMGKGKALVILGARQTGKTTLLKNMVKNRKNVLWLNGDEPDVKLLFEGATSSKLKSLIGSNRTVIIDEAQQIEDIGQKLKLITDQIPKVQLIATGSSAFEMANKLNEPLTGRKREYKLFPLSFSEMVNHHGLIEESRQKNNRLIYGYYPEVVSSPGKEQEVLTELLNSYLYKDILIWGNIKKSDKIIKLLQALAFQIGNEVSYSELGKITGLNNETIEKYVLLLEQSFVVFRLSSFSRNLRKELKKSRKIYFYDLGVRNILISNLMPLELRQDAGALWENFLIVERMKYLSYNFIYGNRYFWRTHDQQEIDYIEERDGMLYAYEFKWNKFKKIKIPKIFSATYPDSEFSIISKNNFEEFIGL